MNKIIILLFLIKVISLSPANGNKLFSHDASHRDFNSALVITVLKFSWEINENLGAGEPKFMYLMLKRGIHFMHLLLSPNSKALKITLLPLF